MATESKKLIAADKALLKAARKGDAAGIRDALAKGADVNARENRGDISGLTPLIHACNEGSLAAVEALLEAGADVAPRVECERGGVGGTAAIDFAIQLIDRELADRTAIVRLLLQAGADANGADSDGRTPLYSAASYGYLGLCEALFEFGADPALVIHHGALHGATNFGKLDSVRMLLDRGVPVDLRTDKGQTPLMLAVYRGHQDLIGLLLGRGADPRAIDDEGQTVLTYAALLTRDAFTDDQHEAAERTLRRFLAFGLIPTPEAMWYAEIAARPIYGQILTEAYPHAQARRPA